MASCVSLFLVSVYLLRPQERPATLILTVTSGLRITRARHVYNKDVQNRKLNIWSSTKNDKNAKNVSIMHSSLSHKIEASVAGRIANITFCRRCLYVVVIY